MKPLILGVGLLLGAGCAAAKTAPEPSSKASPKTARVAGEARFEPPESMLGISGLTQHPDGTYYAIAERSFALFPIRIEDGRPVAGGLIPIAGVPDGLDLESMTFVDENTVAIGTEAKGDRDRDVILYAAFTPEKVTVLDERTRAFFPYEAYGIRPDPNRGVEGICAIGGRLVAASEQFVERDGHRIAALQVYDPLTKGWQAHELVLASDEGKISGLACKGGPAHAQVWGIERHYGTMLVVRFDIPLAANRTQRVRAVVVADLTALLGETPKNFEGIAFAKDGLYLISDNQHGSIDGPTTMIHLVDVEGAIAPYGGGMAN